MVFVFLGTYLDFFWFKFAVVASSLECVCHDNSDSAKRLALQSSLVSPSKRTKQGRESDVLTQSLAPRKLKRRVLGDESMVRTWNKRIRHEIHPGGCEAASDSAAEEGEVIRGLKRKRPSDDVCTDRSLWKRLKEIKV
ncbi:hypothetical protein GOP47_0017373 [Adiantum capillus-veneris]|uniref:Uncharacterized protein n=1 Tax=Adiantum capillus-veneris TaxID=13818 RepID=A0A9D4UFB5_ADICA|nr:hypothetical protein GOP47_0017373 [Adiantum capillus-veneris]